MSDAGQRKSFISGAYTWDMAGEERALEWTKNVTYCIRQLRYAVNEWICKSNWGN